MAKISNLINSIVDIIYANINEFPEKTFNAFLRLLSNLVQIKPKLKNDSINV